MRAELGWVAPSSSPLFYCAETTQVSLSEARNVDREMTEGHADRRQF